MNPTLPRRCRSYCKHLVPWTLDISIFISHVQQLREKCGIVLAELDNVGTIG